MFGITSGSLTRNRSMTGPEISPGRNIRDVRLRTGRAIGTGMGDRAGDQGARAPGVRRAVHVDMGTVAVAADEKVRLDDDAGRVRSGVANAVE